MLGIPFRGMTWGAAILGLVILAAIYFGLNYRKKIGKELVPVVTARFQEHGSALYADAYDRLFELRCHRYPLGC